MTDLTALLVQRTDARVVWRKELIGLIEQIEASLGAVQTEAYVKDRAKSLTAMLQVAALNGEEENLSKALIELCKQATKKVYPTNLAYITATLPILSTWLDTNGKDMAPSETRSVKAAALRLLGQLDIFANRQPVEQADYLAQRLTGVLATAVPKDFSEAQPSLKALKTALDKALQAYKPQIFVTGAEYGDIRKSSRRTCLATDYVRSHCHGKPSCTLIDFTTRAAACGYDPVPFVDAKYRAVTVAYVCISGHLDVWEDPITVPRARKYRLLRTSTEKIVCSGE